MHKKLEADLISLAHQILQLKDKDDVIKLRNKAKDVYEKLAVLAFVDNYFLITPNASENKEELLSVLENANLENNTVVKNEISVSEKSKSNVVEVEETNEKEEMKNLLDDLDEKTQETIKAEANEIVTKILEQETIPVKDVLPKNSLAYNDDFKDSIPADVAANLFEKAETAAKREAVKQENSTPAKEVEKVNVAKKVAPIKEPTTSNQVTQNTKTSLNDKLFNNKLQIGLNDRIAFVKHLFNYSQEEFNRVLSQLNTFETEIAAKDFLNNQVKPDYNWVGKEEYEARLVILIERKFM